MPRTAQARDASGAAKTRKRNSLQSPTVQPQCMQYLFASSCSRKLTTKSTCGLKLDQRPPSKAERNCDRRTLPLCTAKDDFSSVELSQRFQFDLPRPVPPRKNIPLSPSGKSPLSACASHPGYEGRIASRHERGVGCGGRRSVGCAMNSRADERRLCVRRSRVVLASVADVKPTEVLRAEPGFAEPPICRRR